MSHKVRTDLEIISSAAGQSGLRLTNLPSGTAQTVFNGILGIDAAGDVIKIDATKIATVTVGPVAPSSPVVGQQWLDTSVSPSELMIYNGTSWEVSNDEVQHYANFAAFPATGDEDVVYIDDATDTAYLWDSTTSAYVSAVGGASGLFSISDGVTTESIGVGNTITFSENATLTSVFNLAVSATDTVTLGAVAGHTAGQTIVSNGTNFAYGSPIAKRYVNTFTPVANVAFTHTHALGTADPIVQVRDAVTNEVVGVEIIIISATQFNIISTTTDSLRVTAL